MTEKTAIKLDVILHKLNCAGSVSLASKIQQESKTELEYYIEFSTKEYDPN